MSANAVCGRDDCSELETYPVTPTFNCHEVSHLCVFFSTPDRGVTAIANGSPYDTQTPIRRIKTGAVTLLSAKEV